MNVISNRSRLKIAVLIAGVALVGTAYTNCASSGLPDAVTSASSSSSTDNANAVVDAASPLDASLNSATIYDTYNATITALGGTKPYLYSIVSGQANLSTDGVISPPYALGNLVIKVTDSSTPVQTKNLTLAVVATPAVSSVITSCPTSFGSSIAVGTSITAYQASAVSCPATCVSETQTCQATGHMSGTYTAATCAVASCIFKAQSFVQGNCRNGCSNPTQQEVCDTAPIVYGLPASCTFGQTACITGQGGSNHNGGTYTTYTLYKCMAR